MAPLRLEKERIVEIPFHPGKTLKVQVGYLSTDKSPRFMRYTRSISKVREAYRVTLQYAQGEDYTPYVFDIRRGPNAELSIQPDNEDAKTLWALPADPRYAEMKSALETIVLFDIES